MGDDHTLLAELVRLAAAEKSAGDNPSWSEAERAGQVRLKLVCPLAVDGIIRDGLRLELHGPRDVPHDQSISGPHRCVAGDDPRQELALGTARFR